VTPASLLENWQRELRRWAPGLRVQPYFGRERQAVRAELTAWRCAEGRPVLQMSRAACE
jgi:SWI/SNF-related matrix-associated actin-dependent regulator 1 of chromatin subfamily A